ncbi:MAG: hypothetical protein JJ975_00490 [Bacteroidia bacterium]|nr:hypothetical protein [Bacteroidia bacterium]
MKKTLAITWGVWVVTMICSCNTSPDGQPLRETQAQSIKPGYAVQYRPNWFAHGDAAKTKKLMSMPAAMFCDQPSKHPVDIIARKDIDSLKREGVDTILLYRHWLFTNGYNGYGKLIWKERGETRQYQYNFESQWNTYGISSVVYRVSQENSGLRYFLENRLDTITSYPVYPIYFACYSHMPHHFVYFHIDQRQDCFNYTGPLNPEGKHPYEELIRRLGFSNAEYELELKKYGSGRPIISLEE